MSNRARRRVTSLIRPTTLPLATPHLLILGMFDELVTELSVLYDDVTCMEQAANSTEAAEVDRLISLKTEDILV